MMALLLCSVSLRAQIGQPQGTFPIDTSMKKTNTGEWKNEKARITYKTLQSEKEYAPDTSLHTFHRRPFLQPWYHNLGNTGSPTTNMAFTPEFRVGPTLGYHVFDVYRYDIDSVRFYNTNRPYTSFGYQLGSKLEQIASIMHTQNIKPNWNFAAAYRKINSPGFYQLQRSNNDNAYLSTNYQSKNLHYKLNAAFTYNKEQQDENGGIINDSLLNDPNYSDRRTIRVRFQNDAFVTSSTVPRSSVTNTLRDYSVLLQHGYTLGHTDTLYSKDSTSYSLQLTPRFGITHRLEITSEKYRYKDLTPDSSRYDFMFQHAFTRTKDSVFMQQNWLKFDNRVMLNGFLGKRSDQLLVSAGIGARIDDFKTGYDSIRNRNKDNILSNYLVGELRKEAIKPGQWYYRADAMFYLTGDNAGNSLLSGSVGKSIGKWGDIIAGFNQQIGSAPYNYTTYHILFDSISKSFNKESITQLYAGIASDKLKLSAGVRNYLVSNYIYLNQNQQFDQYSSAFNVTEIWLQKMFRWHSIVLDNEIIYQQNTGKGPVNIPTFMGRHQLSIESYILHSSLYIATGVETRYHTPYEPAGYSPFFNRFYYQTGYTVTNTPELSVFFNFRIRNFRAYIMGDQIQQAFSRNVIYAPGYPGQNLMLRFGFNWVMIN